ncbi:hypothetical protein [Thermoactinomyces sp. DSM 45892]|uniref:hypothetical protein n=1 Tax=Thermoactinomyces sp. DSM 45892 TaxID=1882753 RepID=UPI00089C40E4|nr:hypothetical protein [Thermoactinomyces sp. DSM 45892]SDZ14752.1 hypothetical protein SAMN05444416_114103 [Thermoactinomyces sp. DSM 45892]
MRSHKIDHVQESKLFEGEKILVMVGLLGFLLSFGIVIYIAINGAVVLPEGNAWSAFSFDAAIGMFTLSLAAILPLSGLSPGKRKAVRWFFIIALLYIYGAETIQHLRGINPRFSQVNETFDMIVGYLFGIDAVLMIVVSLLLAIPYFRQKKSHERPLVVLGIRYAFISLLFAFAAGAWMSIVQSRFTGSAGNLIVLHGLSFHALQTLPLLGWMTEWMQITQKKARQLIHIGSIAWTISIMLIFVQTTLGHSVFEWTVLPIIGGVILLIYSGITAISMYGALKPLLKKYKKENVSVN